MTFHHPTADIFVPDGTSLDRAIARTTHLGIGAHPDDLEFMAFHGIIQCLDHIDGRWFGGITCTDGAGSARSGRYANFADAEMRAIRRREQRLAADLGRYAFVAQLDHSSKAIAASHEQGLAQDLDTLLARMRPEVVYTHNLADKHATHVAVAAAVLCALRRLPEDQRPKRLLGCEVWRGLDWMCNETKVALNVSGFDHLAAALSGLFDSQIAGGKRYDLGVIGRRAANAVFLDSHAGDAASQICFAMDLTPLLEDRRLDPVTFTLDHIDQFRSQVALNLAKHF